jgi:hypothetical protein
MPHIKGGFLGKGGVLVYEADETASILDDFIERRAKQVTLDQPGQRAAAWAEALRAFVTIVKRDEDGYVEFVEPEWVKRDRQKAALVAAKEKLEATKRDLAAAQTEVKRLEYMLGEPEKRSDL